MARGDQTLRQWKLLLALERLRYGATVDELSADLEVSRRTVQRDLAVLRDVGLPLKAETAAHGRKRWRLEPKLAEQLKVSFTFSEAIALYLGRQFLQSAAGAPIAGETRRAFKKIHDLLDPTAFEHFARLPKLLYLKPRHWPDGIDRSDVFDRLMLAWEDRRAVRLTYAPPWSKAPFTVDVHPYGLAMHDDDWYLLALYPRRGQIRHYKLGRIRSADLLDETYRIPADFSPEAHLHDSFGIFQPEKPTRVTIRIHPDMAWIATETRWHPSQKTRPQKDGSVLVDFTVGHLEELKRWVLSLGAFAEVLVPDSLRREVSGELSGALRHYEQSASESMSH